MGQKLPPNFYQRSTKKVACELLGKQLVHVLKSGVRLGGLIVETEAYLGPTDPGAHTYKGRRTERVASMYKAGGHAYVYFTYGAHFCINAVTQFEDVPEGVLIRALQPTLGLERLRKNRGVAKDLDLTSGPGKLTQALEIDRRLDGISLNSSHLYIEDVGVKVPHSRVVVCARIGLNTDHEAAHWPLRYYIRDNPHVSKRDRQHRTQCELLSTASP